MSNITKLPATTKVITVAGVSSFRSFVVCDEHAPAEKRRFDVVVTPDELNMTFTVDIIGFDDTKSDMEHGLCVKAVCESDEHGGGRVELPGMAFELDELNIITMMVGKF